MCWPPSRRDLGNLYLERAWLGPFPDLRITSLLVPSPQNASLVADSPCAAAASWMGCWCFLDADRVRSNRALATDSFLAHLGVLGLRSAGERVNRARLVRRLCLTRLSHRVSTIDAANLHARVMSRSWRGRSANHQPIACLMIDVDHFKAQSCDNGHHRRRCRCCAKLRSASMMKCRLRSGARLCGRVSQACFAPRSLCGW